MSRSNVDLIYTIVRVLSLFSSLLWGGEAGLVVTTLYGKFFIFPLVPVIGFFSTYFPHNMVHGFWSN